MASSITKATCAKCDKGAGTAMCYGCQQGFCTKHFIEHRQELSQQIDGVGQEHDGLRRDLTNEQGTHPLIDRINEWEQESITKIQTAAISARSDLHQLLNRAKTSLNTSFNKMAEELQSSRDSDDYTELDIKKWSDQLQEFRKILDNPSSVKIDYDNDAESMIRFMKVTDEQPSESFHQALELPQHDNPISGDLDTNVSERFEDVFGSITLFESDLVATCLTDNRKWSCVSGIGRYSSGTHQIHFRIEEIGRLYPFFGIVNSSEKMTDDILQATSCYGWWDLDYFIMSGKMNRRKANILTQVKDQLTLILDSDNRRIQLQHHRTDRTVDIAIDLQMCAFPWKMIVLLRKTHDCVRILH